MKKHLLPLTLILTCLFVSSSSYAFTAIDWSCGTVLSMHDASSSSAKSNLPSWIQGYITGRNYENGKDLNASAEL